MILIILGRALQMSANLTFIKEYRTKFWKWLSSCLKRLWCMVFQDFAKFSIISCDHICH